MMHPVTFSQYFISDLLWWKIFPERLLHEIIFFLSPTLLTLLIKPWIFCSNGGSRNYEKRRRKSKGKKKWKSSIIREPVNATISFYCTEMFFKEFNPRDASRYEACGAKVLNIRSFPNNGTNYLCINLTFSL